jgi:hypothetical protein
MTIQIIGAGMGSLGAGNITGAFTRCEVPSELAPGKEIKVVVDGNVSDQTRSPTAIWTGCFTVEGDGRRDYDTFTVNGKSGGPTFAPTLSLGIMPDVPVNVTVKLWGNPHISANWVW